MRKFTFMHIAALGLLSMSTGAEALLAGGGGGAPETPAQQSTADLEIEADEGTEATALEAAKLEAAQAKAAEIVALPIGKMKGPLSQADLFTLRTTLLAEEKGLNRVGAIKSIEFAIDRNPEQIAAVAAAQAALAPPPAERAGPVILAEHAPPLSNLEVLELHQLGAPLAIYFGRHDFAYPELAPVAVTIERASDGRALVSADIYISGIGLEAALPIEEAWLVAEIDGEALIVRRCEIPSNMLLEPGLNFKYPARSLIF